MSWSWPTGEAWSLCRCCFCKRWDFALSHFPRCLYELTSWHPGAGTPWPSCSVCYFLWHPTGLLPQGPCLNHLSLCQHQDGDFRAGSFSQLLCAANPFSYYPYLSTPPLLLSSVQLGPWAFSDLSLSLSLSNWKRFKINGKAHRLIILWNRHTDLRGELSMSLSWGAALVLADFSWGVHMYPQKDHWPGNRPTRVHIRAMLLTALSDFAGLSFLIYK